MAKKSVSYIITEWEEVDWEMSLRTKQSKKKYCLEWFSIFKKGSTWKEVMKELVGMNKYLMNNK